MRRIVVSEFMTVDGVMEAPGGETTIARTGWVAEFPHDEWAAWKLDEVLTHEALLLGRTTYESFAGAWPTYSDDVGFADKMNAMPKYVVSSTLTGPAWNNTTVVGGDVRAAVAELTAQPGGDLLVAGSRTLVQELLALDLVDELRLLIFPVILGEGRRLFAESGPKHTLRRTDCQTFPSGTSILTYARA